MGANTPAARYLRPTLISGNIYELNTTAGNAANNTTIARYAAGGSTSARRWRPTQVTTANAPVPANGTAPANDGWRDLTPINTAERITFDAGNWVVRLRYRRSGQTLEQNISAEVTAILYNGTSGAELGRVMLELNFTTTVQTATFNIPVGAVSFAAGDRIQLEVYVVALVAGLPGAPAVATDLWLTINEAEANSGARAAPQTYAVNFARTLTVSPTFIGVATLTRKISARITMPVTMIGVTPVFIRQVRKPLSATMVGAATLLKKVGKPLPTVTMVGVASIIKKIKATLTTATMVGVASVTPHITAFRTMAVTMVGVPTLSRAITARRVMEATMVGVATMVRKTGKVFDAIMVGLATLDRRVAAFRTLAATMIGVPSFTKKVGKTLSAVMIGVATLVRAITVRRVMEATMVGVARILAKIPIERIPGGAAILRSTYSRSRVVNK